MEAENNKPFTIRSYRPSDREAVRKLCCETGFLGEPIDPVYEDRELFADFLTTYYTDHEPESCFLLEIDGTIRGYLLGSRYPFRNQLYAFAQNIILFFRALLRYARYHSHSRRFFRWAGVALTKRGYYPAGVIHRAGAGTEMHRCTLFAGRLGRSILERYTHGLRTQ